MRQVRRGGGFTFIEIMIGLAIVVMIAATVTPAVLTTLDRARIESIKTTGTSVIQGLIDFEDDVSRYPQYLSQLSTPINPSQRDICNNTYSNGRANSWSGSYLTPAVGTNGLPTPVGVLSDTIGRYPTTGTPTVIYPYIRNVTVEDAQALDREVDNSDGQSAGTIWWGDEGNGLVTLYFLMFVNQC